MKCTQEVSPQVLCRAWYWDVGGSGGWPHGPAASELESPPGPRGSPCPALNTNEAIRALSAPTPSLGVLLGVHDSPQKAEEE